MTDEHALVSCDVETCELTASSNIDGLIRLAVERNIDVDKLERLVAMHYAEQERRGIAEYCAAMARFREICPPIRKTLQGQHATKKGSKRLGWYAPIDEISRTINPHLSSLGLSYRFGDMVIDGEHLTNTCTISHVGGHSESSAVTMPVVSKAGMSPQQKYAAADTYARRLALTAVLGLTTCDEDTDGDERETIDADQLRVLEDLISDTGANLARLMAMYGISSLDQLPAFQFDGCRHALEMKRK